MKIDLHVHAQERSDCATSSEEDQIQAAIAARLDGLAFTDHQRLVPRHRLIELNQKYTPFKIFTGIEIRADQEDWLVYGVYDASLESLDWRYPDLASFVRNKEGFIALAHPFRYSSTIQVDLAACPPDGIEISSYNTPAQQAGTIRAISARYGLALLQNSDAHHTGRIGHYYNVIPEPLANDADLLKTLRKMKVEPLVSQE